MKVNMKSLLTKNSITRQHGFTLIEVMIVLGIVALAIAGLFFLRQTAEDGQQAEKVSTDIALMASKIKSLYRGANSYATLSASELDKQALITKPMKYDGTNMLDPWGNTMTINGSAATYAITLGGATNPITKESCNTIAALLATNASLLRVGTSATATAGVISGGNLVLASSGASVVQTAMTTGCAEASPVIAIQYR
jgi:prepilin-type N-terminal cleavage/methylation domain-containing protein